MKILVPILLLVLCVAPASGVALLPSPSATNDMVELRLAANFNASMQNYRVLSGRVGRLEHEIDRLEAGFLVLSVLAGAAITALCVLVVRDAVWKRMPGTKLATQPRADPLVNAKADIPVQGYDA